MTVSEFIGKWRKVELKERSAAQEHFLDLCSVFDHPTPAAADPTGETFCFEKGTAKHGGGDGFADVWKRGFFGWEYKGKHKDLEAAYDQLLRYRNALESPPLLVLCDLDRIIIRTNFTGTVSATHEIPLEALAEPRNIEIVRAVFHNPDTLRPGRTSAAVTQDAAVRIGEIAASMRERGLDPAVVAHFLDRIVFCLFAEDARLLPDMVFSRIVSKSGGEPARFGKTLGMLFEAMAAGGDFGVETIRHFNGNLFDDPPSPGGYGAASRTVPALTDDDVKRFTAAASLDWSAVDPSIFGTLFERGLDPAKRSQLGAHFTGREDFPRDGSCVSHPNHANPVILSEIAWLADIYVWHDCKIHMIGERRSQRERHPEKDNGTRNRGAPGSSARSSTGDYRVVGSGVGPAWRLTGTTSWN
jgi:hypothetical protein